MRERGRAELGGKVSMWTGPETLLSRVHVFHWFQQKIGFTEMVQFELG